jgi:hypothetical protein
MGIATSAAAEGLPHGVPHTVYPDGSFDVEPLFTTPEYQQEAFKMVLREANLVAKELQLPERLPIVETDVVARFIVPFGYGRETKSIGNITTRSYWYNVKEDYKFSDMGIADYDETCLGYRKRYQCPLSQVDTNAAFQLATKWLMAVSMDVQGLNHDCEAHVAPTSYWNDVSKLGEMPKGPTFVPIYYVWWTSSQNQTNGFGCTASVELLLPEKRVLQLCVYDSRYILRKPLVFTNLALLFPQTNAQIRVITNLSKPKVLYPTLR